MDICIRSFQKFYDCNLNSIYSKQYCIPLFYTYSFIACSLTLSSTIDTKRVTTLKFSTKFFSLNSGYSTNICFAVISLISIAILIYM